MKKLLRAVGNGVVGTLIIGAVLALIWVFFHAAILVLGSPFGAMIVAVGSILFILLTAMNYLSDDQPTNKQP